jgi:hypothetical protein
VIRVHNRLKLALLNRKMIMKNTTHRNCLLQNSLKYDSRKGSLTVEAAFVMPIVIFIIFATIYLAFYLHDRCVIQAMLDKTLHKAGISIKHASDIETGEVDYENIGDRGVFYLLFGNNNQEETQIKEYLQQELTGRLFLCKIKSVEVEVNNFNLSVIVKAETDISLSGIKGLIDPLSLIKMEGNYPIHNPAESIRRFEIIIDTGSQIKGVDTLKSKIEEFLVKLKR